MANELFRFKTDLDAFAKKADLAIAFVVQRIATDLFAHIVGNFPAHRHPVDTGRARAGWAMSIGAPVAPVPAPGKYPAAPVPPDFTQIDGTQVVYILNNVQYIGALENGHSKQAPNGFVHLSLMEIEAELNGQSAP